MLNFLLILRKIVSCLCHCLWKFFKFNSSKRLCSNV